MKTYLVFNSDDMDDRYDLAIHNQARALLRAIWEYDQALRAKVKYSDDPKEEEWAETARELLWDKLNEEGASLDPEV